MKPIFTLLITLSAGPSLFAQTPARTDTLSQPEQQVLAESLADSDYRPGPRLLEDPAPPADSSSHKVPVTFSFKKTVEAVLQDFPNNLRNITGGLVLAQGETNNYASLVELPGSENCSITRYHSVDDTTASWQARMYSADDFKKAAHEYHELYKKLEVCYVKLVDGSIIYLQGEWEPAREDVSFTTSTLRLTTGDWRYKEVKVELELVYQLSDWVVNINIVSKKRDDEVGGPLTP
jgi:hypothetical protein